MGRRHFPARARRPLSPTPRTPSDPRSGPRGCREYREEDRHRVVWRRCEERVRRLRHQVLDQGGLHRQLRLAVSMHAAGAGAPPRSGKMAALSCRPLSLGAVPQGGRPADVPGQRREAPARALPLVRTSAHARHVRRHCHLRRNAPRQRGALSPPLPSLHPARPAAFATLMPPAWRTLLPVPVLLCWYPSRGGDSGFPSRGRRRAGPSVTTQSCATGRASSCLARGWPRDCSQSSRPPHTRPLAPRAISRVPVPLPLPLSSATSTHPRRVTLAQHTPHSSALTSRSSGCASSAPRTRSAPASSRRVPLFCPAATHPKRWGPHMCRPPPRVLSQVMGTSFTFLPMGQAMITNYIEDAKASPSNTHTHSPTPPPP